MNIEIRKGSVEDTEKLICFLQQIRSDMENPDWFYLDPPEDVRYFMKSGAMQLWIAMDGDTIAAIFDYLIPGLESYNYGYDLGFSKKELLQVINMDNSAVHPNYRGMGLQRKMISIAEEHLRQEGTHILLCTVHPDNQFSLQNVLQQGYSVQRRLSKYGSERYILRKDI